jgi:2'-hydroxyisoflavone reductase
MKILILGGTVFVGRHLVDAALARRHEVTLFNRGEHNPDLFPQVEKLRGDRTKSLDALRDKHWDAVIDTCGYVPRVVRESAEFLKNAVDLYVFISSISVYADYSKPGLDEGSAVGVLKDESVEEVTNETYGPLKALCEKAAVEAMSGRTLVIRPGLIVGPYDPSDRFTYWVLRVDRGGTVLAPGPKEREMQIIDARDLAAWIIHMIEELEHGVYNAVGPKQPLSFERFLAECRKVSASDASFEWVSEEFILANNVHVPVWVPKSAEGISSVNIGRALSKKLRFTPLSQTVAETLLWAKRRPKETKMRVEISQEKEKELLDAWRSPPQSPPQSPPGTST